jgi:uncharacterized surface protein with fasciclin (FAS1) repeats
MLTVATVVLCVAVALVNGNPSGYRPKMSYTAPPISERTLSIVDILTKNSDIFSTLITAAKAANLVDTLATGMIYTVIKRLFNPYNLKSSSYILYL